MPWSVTVMVIAIVMIVSIARVAKARDRAILSDPPADNPDAARMREEVLRLKERVQVLERVITDNRSSMDLHGEIERLRER